MDFGVLGLDGYVGSVTGTGVCSQVSAPESRTKILGSGFDSKLENPSGSDLRASKMLRTEDFSVSKTMPLHDQGKPSLMRSNSITFSCDDSPQQEHHVFSFSSLKPEATLLLSKDGGLVEKNTQNATAFPYCQQAPSFAHPRSSGTGNFNANLHGSVNGVRGPFTPSQWMELEHQALIYKYITSNISVPSNLLIPLKKSLYPYALSGFPAGSYPPNTLGWGTFHLGYAGSTTDPEPGRCRRTDGKKWRCSRDAVADQKYCERHINRGRHRSRKPVEGQIGHAAAGTTNSKVVPMTTTSVSASVLASSSASNSLTIAHQQFKNVQPGVVNSSTDALVNRARDPRGLSMMSSAMNLKSNESTFAVPKQDIPIEESFHPEFGFVSSDSLLNPTQRSLYLNSKNYESYLNFNDQETRDQHPLRQFTEDWPKDHSNRSVITWNEDLKSDWTKLSMSIPMASSDFSSSTSSPTQEKLAFSPLRLSREFDPVHMGLGTGSDLSETSEKQVNWIPISWDTSMGGPLGEVLTTSTGNAGSWKSSSGLSLLTGGWDRSPPQPGSSPTGVLQKVTFASLSNSSSVSSPIAESKKNNDGASICDDVVGSKFASSTVIPSL